MFPEAGGWGFVLYQGSRSLCRNWCFFTGPSCLQVDTPRFLRTSVPSHAKPWNYHARVIHGDIESDVIARRLHEAAADEACILAAGAPCQGYSPLEGWVWGFVTRVVRFCSVSYNWPGACNLVASSWDVLQKSRTVKRQWPHCIHLQTAWLELDINWSLIWEPNGRPAAAGGGVSWSRVTFRPSPCRLGLRRNPR